jgi:uncharacterized RDD family membrane protein YckC
MSQSVNPYAPPTHDVDAMAGPSSGVRPVGAGTRFAHLILDLIGYYLVLFLCGFLAALTEMVVFSVVGVAFAFGYHLIFEATLGRTPAKFITGCHVVTAEGKRPTFAQIVGRSFARFVPFEPFSFLGSDAVGWHDRWSGTRVVKLLRD